MSRRARLRPRTPSACSTPGCPNLSDRGKCSVCRREVRKQTDARRPNSAARGYGHRWKRTRARYLRQHPICEHEEGCITLAVEVHHRDGLGPNGPNGHADSNLQALCSPHHSQVTAQMQPGGWAA